jgi:hypothetical protein
MFQADRLDALCYTELPMTGPRTSRRRRRYRIGDAAKGQDTSLRQPRSPIVAAVGHSPKRCGDSLIRLAMDILTQKAVPPAVFARHEVVTRETADHHCPNDALPGACTCAGF